ncbi:MAG: hypothetical protein FJ387_05740 [Verrucomicrobia bacterium]|nr:hypothetical protein [Verrucomicrobiota bacterium]
MRTTGAYALRETTGTSGLELTLQSAVSILAHFEVAHLVVGGMAVQEHGYFRVTLDADLVVADVQDAVELLTADLSGPFRRCPGCEDTVQDKRNRVHINLLPAGRVLRAGCQVPFPVPQEVSEEPRFVTLEQLISLKLDSWSHSPLRRLKDKADVIELIKYRRLPRDLAVAEPVRSLYRETWDALAAEPEADR